MLEVHYVVVGAPKCTSLSCSSVGRFVRAGGGVWTRRLAALWARGLYDLSAGSILCTWLIVHLGISRASAVAGPLCMRLGGQVASGSGRS